MAYIEPHPTNPRIHRIRWRDHTSGKLAQVTFIGTLRDAEKECQHWARKEQLSKNGFIDNRVNMNVTLGSLEEWYFNYGLKWKNLKREKPISEKTNILTKRAFSHFIRDFGPQYPVDSLSSTDYREKNPHRKLNGLNVNIRSLVAVINVAIAHKHKVVKRMPSELFKFTVDHGTPFYLEPDVVNEILALDLDELYQDKPWDFDRRETMRIFMLYLHTGCRLTELLTLTWDKVSFAEKSIIVTGKGDKTRKVYVTEAAMEIFMEIADRERPMPYTNFKVRSRLNDLNRFTGVKFTPHNLRSTCGSFMLSAGCSIEEVSDHLGHEDIQTTRKWYARIIDEKRRDATAKLEKFARHLPFSSSPLVERPNA